MKENTYKILNILLIVLLVIIVIAAFSVGIYLVLSKNEAEPVFSDTDTEPVTETTCVTEPVTTATEETTVCPQTEPPEPITGKYTQEELDEIAADIGAWAEANVPLYKTPEETDEEGNIQTPSEDFRPPVAFYYMDVESGKTMEYNSDRVFYTASIIKEPYVLWALREIEKAEAEGNAENTKYDLDNLFVYTEDKFRSGSGVIQSAEFGTAYSYYDLLKLTITDSDNVAFAERRRIYGMSGFNEFSESIGVKNPQKKLFSATAKEMGVYLAQTYDYFESGSQYSEALKSWMLNTNHRVMIPSAVKPLKAANKYGWDIGAYHDMAIVFDESPYLLVIMTELDNGSGADNRFIRELASKINSVHAELHSGGEDA